MLDTEVRDRALGILDGMERIICQERLVHAKYTETPRDRQQEGYTATSCGTRHCLIGTLFAAANAPVDGVASYEGDSVVEFVHVGVADRWRYFREDPAAGVVYDALNRVAGPRIEQLPDDRREATIESSFYDGGSVAEAYFERGEPKDEPADDYLFIRQITSAAARAVSPEWHMEMLDVVREAREDIIGGEGEWEITDAREAVPA